MSNILKCVACDSELSLKVAFSGADWDTEAGEGSGYEYPISLECTNDHCARVYRLGHLNNAYAFSPMKNHKPYTVAEGFIEQGRKTSVQNS